MKPRCPDPERFALLIENRLGRTSRARILRHAADCVSCRRHLAISSLTPTGPLRAALLGSLHSGKLTVCAGFLLGLLVLRFIGSGGGPEPAPAPRLAKVGAPQKPERRGPRSAEGLRSSELPAPPPGVPETLAPPHPEERASIGAVVDEAVPAVSTGNDFLTVAKPRPRESVTVGPTPPPPSPKVVEVESMGRLAILDPFGGLALEGAGGRSVVQGSRVVQVEARLTAVGRSSGFRLADGLRVQLAAGSTISMFQNLTRRCAGLSVLQGALLVESTQTQSLFLRREGTAGVLEGLNGPVLLNTGPRGDAVTVTPMGTTGLVWRRIGQAPVEVGAGDTLLADTNTQEIAARGTKPKPSVSRFASWPEPSSLFYSSFEEEVQGMERPLVVQGSSKEGYVTAAVVAGAKGRKTIELTLPASLQNLPSDATVRLRIRTTATRLQFGLGGNSSRSVPIIVPQRNRSESAWTAVTVSLASLDQDVHRGRGGGMGARQAPRGNLTFVAEAPSRLAPEDLVFDLDEIEISRS